MTGTNSYLKITLLLALFVFSAADLSAEVWQELKGEHFLVYYTSSKTFAKSTLEKAEMYYTKIADNLGYARHSKFWSWHNRVKIYIYPNQGAYLKYVKSMGYAEWSVGFADYQNKEIVSFHKSRGFLDVILPHEITHLIFRDYVGQHNIPMWIDEGVAQWEEDGKVEYVQKELKRQLQHHSPIPFERMMSLNVGKISNEAIIELYYLQAVSVVDFLIRRYGSDKFISFCRQLRDGKNLDEALRFSYPTAIRSVEELQNEWLDFIEAD